MLFGVLSHGLHVLGEVDEGFVFNSRAAGAADDVKRVQVEVDDGSNAAVVDVVNDVQTCGDFFAFAVVGQRQRHADGISDASANELFKRNSRLDDSIRRHAGFGDTQM